MKIVGFRRWCPAPFSAADAVSHCRNGTSEVIEGTPTPTWSTQQIFTGDFNEDGFVDAAFVSTGAEFAVQNNDAVHGYHTTILISQKHQLFDELCLASAWTAPNRRL